MKWKLIKCKGKRSYSENLIIAFSFLWRNGLTGKTRTIEHVEVDSEEHERDHYQIVKTKQCFQNMLYQFNQTTETINL